MKKQFGKANGESKMLEHKIPDDNDISVSTHNRKRRSPVITLILAKARKPHLERHGRVRRAVASNLPAIIINIADCVMLTSLLMNVNA